MSSLCSPEITVLLAAGAALCPCVGSDDAWPALTVSSVWLQCSSIASIFQQLAARCSTPLCWPQVLRFVLDAVRAEGFNSKRTLFLFGSYTIGKEKIFLEVARALKRKVWPQYASITLPQQRMCLCVSLLSWTSHLGPAYCLPPVLRTLSTGADWWLHHVVHGCKRPAVDAAGFVHMLARTAKGVDLWEP